ncbi:septum site-determining protein, partial [Paenibacillus riograndensis]
MNVCLAKHLLTTQTRVMCPGEESLGHEAVTAGTAAPGSTFVNVVRGPYGRLVGQGVERGGSTVVEVNVPFEEVAAPDVIASAIEQYQPDALSFVHAEVVTGGSNPAQDIFKLAQKYKLITVSDSVSAVGGEALNVDEWGVDFAVIGAQKALAGPNGVSAVSISPRGWEFLES